VDIQVEIDTKKDLEAAAAVSQDTLVRGKALLADAENILAEAAVYAYNKGASVSFISDALGINRSRIYMLLATKGVRPGKDVVDATA
jgi:hypothetical protein